MTEPVVLRTALGQHAHVQPLKTGRVGSARVQFEFHEFDPLPKAFRRMVREGDLDLCEMALTTHLLAHLAGKPIVALPIPLWARLHHANLICARDGPVRGPADLAGAPVGVRAYSQTTGVWLRGILQHAYGIDPASIRWITAEDAHVAEYRDPPNVGRVPTGRTLRDLLRDGEVLALMGEREVDPAGVRPVIEEADAEAERWRRETGIFPVNHIVSVRAELLDRHPWLAGELTMLFEESRRLSQPSGPAAALPYALEPNRRSIQMLLDFAHEQGLSPRRMPADELFATESEAA